ncbi:putative hydro-lyase [Maioricimonas sp. JC845]|uniref:putative hydro-lyase n=1 Tax=Maioricimonas sp. JC845 TaxID=3232138 RepID=UPI00345ADC03
MTAASAPADVRHQARDGRLTGPTAGLAPGFTQANLVILPREHAFPFLLFCQRNPRPCPVLEVTEPGDPVPRRFAPSADLRTDLPRYRVWRDGELADEPTDISSLWQEDFVSFLIGCSFTFEAPLLDAGLPVRHIELGCNVPMYRTSIDCVAAPPFRGKLVVSMRPFLPPQAIQAIQITSRFPAVHGAPVHFGDPAQIGIEDISRPDFGDAVEIRPGETPVFWACGVTPQVALMQARLPLVITHSPGCMFVTDRPDAELAAN